MDSTTLEKLYTLRWLARFKWEGEGRDEALEILDDILGGSAKTEDDDEPAPVSTEAVNPADDPYEEVFKKSPNQSSGITPKFIVLHSSYGSYGGDTSWILKDNSNVSYHYLINPDNGNRTQFVGDTKKAWHAGRSEWKGYNGLNSHSIGISFTGPSSRRASDTEIDSAAWKCVYLIDKFPDIKVSDIITHKMIAPGRKDDTSAENHRRVLTRVKALLGQTN